MKAIPNSVWKVSNPARSTYTQDGAVILDIQKGLCYSLRSIDRTVRSEPPRARTSSARSALHRVRWKSLRQALRDAAEPNAQRRSFVATVPEPYRTTARYPPHIAVRKPRENCELESVEPSNALWWADPAELVGLSPARIRLKASQRKRLCSLVISSKIVDHAVG